MTQEQEILFKIDPFVKLLLETEGLGSISIIGGAVIDILEGREVKDYDLIGFSPSQVEKLGLTYSHETKTATTYIKDSLIIQALKTQKEDFDFKISQATLTVDYRKTISLNIDDSSFKNKMLIPCDRCWTEKKNALNSLQRIPHWRKKGYIINDITYLSLLGVAAKNININS
jgi:hypothetical protein